MPRKKKEEVVVAKKESRERSSAVVETKDQALTDVLQEPGAGASEEEIDIESPIGEDAAIEASALNTEKYADEINAESSGEIVEEAPEVIEVAAEKEPAEAKKDKKLVKASVEQKRKKPLHSKKYRNAVKDLDLTQSYSKEEAVALVKKTSYTSFDATVEVHIKLSVQNQRGIITLPSGTGRERKVAVVTSDNIEDMLTSIEAGKIDFDILVATPDVMPKLSKVAKILGPKGLMPNPKSGTVTADTEKAKHEFSGGRVEFKQDKGGVVHLAIGKVSFSDEQLLENLHALLAALPAPKITTISLSSTMGPGIRVTV